MVLRKIAWEASRESFPILIATAEAVRAKKRLFAMKPPAVEVRLDLLREVPLPELALFMLEARRRKISILLTARRARDGGRWRARDEAARRRALLAWAPLADAVDVELDFGRGLEDFLLMLACHAGRRLAIIFSIHRMKGMLPDSKLDALAFTAAGLAKSHAVPARLKLALLARTCADAARVEGWAMKKHPIPVTVIAMGEAGRETRWRIPLLTGGPAYAPFGKAVAPGQVAWPELVRKLRPPSRRRRSKRSSR